MRSVSIVLLLAACHDEAHLQYPWDDRKVLCSVAVDDLSQDFPWDEIQTQIEYAATHDSVALFHAHVPNETISEAALTRILDLADAKHLAYVTYRDLDAGGTPRAGVAFAFDDQAVDAWFAERALLDQHGARVTFFATRYANWTADQHAELAELDAAGHDVQAHSVMHLNAVDYVAAHGLDAYMNDEALPSIAILEADGYPITAYAFPFGASNDALDDALLEHVHRVRVSPGSCPY